MVIDVRNGGGFASLHIKGSHHVPLAMLSEHTEEFAAKMGTRVVLVCQQKLVSPKMGLVAGGMGAGLTLPAATNSCAMGQLLSKMPWNRSASESTAHQALQNLDARA